MEVFFRASGAAHADPAAAGRRQSRRPVRRDLHRFGRWSVRPGRRGASRPFQGVDLLRAGSARRRSSVAASSPATRASSSARNTAAPRRVVVPVLQALGLDLFASLPRKQGPKASHRLGSKSGAVLLFFAPLWRGKASQTSRRLCRVFCSFPRIHFLLLRGVFSVLFGQAFAKPASFITPVTNGWVLRIKYGCTVGSFCPWGAVSRQLWHRWMSERFSSAILLTVLLGLFLLPPGCRRVTARLPGGARLSDRRSASGVLWRFGDAVAYVFTRGNVDGVAVHRRRHDLERSACFTAARCCPSWRFGSGLLDSSPCSFRICGVRSCFAHVLASIIDRRLHLLHRGSNCSASAERELLARRPASSRCCTARFSGARGRSFSFPPAMATDGPLVRAVRIRDGDLCGRHGFRCRVMAKSTSRWCTSPPR